MRKPLRYYVFLTGLLVSGCAHNIAYVAPDYGVLGRKVAVMPMSNESNDLDGPVYVRDLLQRGLMGRGFILMEPPIVDAKLKEQGFTDGGQLAATTPQKIGEWTGADVIFYSVLEEFNYINIGVYAQRHVKVHARIMDAKTGEKLWESTGDYSTRVLATDKKGAEELFAVQLAAKAVEKIAHVPLQRESQVAVARLLNTLPYR